MTDADDAGLVEDGRRKVRGFAMAHDGILMTQLADRIESQRREIEELRREVAEAVKLIHRLVHMAGVHPSYELMDAASAFAAKHGGRDG